MGERIRHTIQWPVLTALTACVLLSVIAGSSVGALNKLPTPDPKPGSYGLEATKPKAPPTRGATITTPGNGASFSGTNSPITVSGICPNGLLVEIYNNGVMVGSVMCKSSSFSLRVSLFVGRNELSAIVYDELGQAGPRSRLLTVRYSNTDFAAFAEQITLTSSYGRRSSPVGDGLRWPLQLSGGSGPYAFSIDWGDGSEPQLKSQEVSGVVTVAHAYKRAGIYQVNIVAKDVNGASAYLQLVAVSNGKIDTAQDTDEEKSSAARVEILWIPTGVAMVLLLPAFWLGRRSQLVSLRNKMLKERESYEKEQGRA